MSKLGKGFNIGALILGIIGRIMRRRAKRERAREVGEVFEDVAQATSDVEPIVEDELKQKN